MLIQWKNFFFNLRMQTQASQKYGKIDYDLSIDFTILVLKLMRNQM